MLVQELVQEPELEQVLELLELVKQTAAAPSLCHRIWST